MGVFQGDRKDEEDLIQAAAQGNHVAFEDLFHQYYDMIHAYAYRMCCDAVEAADLAQETWIKVARSLPFYRGNASFKNWVYAVAHNVILDAGRRKARERRLRDQLQREPLDETAFSPHERDSEALEGALLSLPADQRAAVTLVYLEEMRHGDAAKILGCAEATVSWRLFQARRKLKKFLSQETAP